MYIEITTLDGTNYTKVKHTTFEHTTTQYGSLQVMVKKLCCSFNRTGKGCTVKRQASTFTRHDTKKEVVLVQITIISGLYHDGVKRVAHKKFHTSTKYFTSYISEIIVTTFNLLIFRFGSFNRCTIFVILLYFFLKIG